MVTGRVWVYVRDDRPFRRQGSFSGAILLVARPHARAFQPALGELRRHSEADAFDCYNRPYLPNRKPGRFSAKPVDDLP
jgi:transposase